MQPLVPQNRQVFNEKKRFSTVRTRKFPIFTIIIPLFYAIFQYQNTIFRCHM